MCVCMCLFWCVSVFEAVHVVLCRHQGFFPFDLEGVFSSAWQFVSM